MSSTVQRKRSKTIGKCRIFHVQEGDTHVVIAYKYSHLVKTALYGGTRYNPNRPGKQSPPFNLQDHMETAIRRLDKSPVIVNGIGAGPYDTILPQDQLELLLRNCMKRFGASDSKNSFYYQCLLPIKGECNLNKKLTRSYEIKQKINATL